MRDHLPEEPDGVADLAAVCAAIVLIAIVNAIAAVALQ